MPTLTRRKVLAITSGAIAMAPVSAFAATNAKPAAQIDDAWARLASACKEMSRDGELVVSRARAYGLNVENFAGVQITGADRGNRRLILVFGDWLESKSNVHHVTSLGVEKVNG